MKKNNFEEYFEENYSEYIANNLKEQLSTEYAKTNNIDKTIVCDIKNIRIQSIVFTKSELDLVEFDCYIRALYRITICDYYKCIDLIKDNYIMHFAGTFANGFNLKKHEIEQINNEPFAQKLTNELIPVIKKEQMDNYATEFLKYYYPDALKTSMKIPVELICKKTGLKRYNAPLNCGTFGEIHFSDSFDYYDDDNLKYGKIESGTILVNESMIASRGENTRRSTLVHEMVHWFFHKNYYELRTLLNREFPQMKFNNKEVTDKNIKWMEIQTRSITSKILMPKEMFLKKYNELLRETTIIINNKLKNANENIKKLEIYRKVAYALAEFFGVSAESVKYRLISLGYYEFDGILNFDVENKKYFIPYSFKPGTLERNQTFFINYAAYLLLILSNSLVSNKVEEEVLIYTNGLIVLNDPQYVTNRKINTFGLAHVDCCCLKFNIIGSEAVVSNNSSSFILTNERNRIKNLIIDNEQYEKIMQLCNQNLVHYNKHKSKLPSTYGDTMLYHIKHKYDDDRPHTEDIARICDLTPKTVRNYIYNDVEDCKFEVIIKFCLGLRLSLPYIQDLLNKSKIIIDGSNIARFELLETIRFYPRCNIKELCSIENIKPELIECLKLSNRWKSSNNTNI